MNPRKAILDAANQIERHPHTFSFTNGVLPSRDGPDGGEHTCALAWIGYYADHQRPETERMAKPFELGYWEALPILGLAPELPEYVPGFLANREAYCMGERKFYDQLSEISGYRPVEWTVHANLCATVLRRYADKYFPEAVVQEQEVEELLAA